MLLPALNSARRMARDSSCKSNQKQVGLMLLSYAGNYNGWVLQYNSSDCALAFVATQEGRNFRWNVPSTLGLYHCPELPVSAGEVKSYAYIGGLIYGTVLFTTQTVYSVKVQGYNSKYGVYLQNLYRYAPDISPSMRPYLADSSVGFSTVFGKIASSEYFYTYNQGTGGYGYLYLQHRNRANVWFADGHVGSVISNELKPKYNIKTVRLEDGTQVNF